MNSTAQRIGRQGGKDRWPSSNSRPMLHHGVSATQAIGRSRSRSFVPLSTTTASSFMIELNLGMWFGLWQWFYIAWFFLMCYWVFVSWCLICSDRRGIDSSERIGQQEKKGIDLKWGNVLCNLMDIQAQNWEWGMMSVHTQYRLYFKWQWQWQCFWCNPYIVYKSSAFLSMLLGVTL